MSEEYIPKYPKRKRVKRVPRQCLKCGETFKSEGNGNRLCESCQLIQPSVRIYSWPSILEVV